MVDKSVTVLIVDDSRIFRSALESSLAGLEDIKVIGSAFSGEKALELIAKERPRIVTLDVELPGMDGLETLKEILKINKSTPNEPPIEVLMLSAFTKKGADITMQALELGAFDFLTKPVGKTPEESLLALKNILILKIRNFNSKTGHINVETSVSKEPIVKTPKPNQIPPNAFSFDAILIGVSTGGPKALMSFLPLLSEKVDVPIFIVQHMPPKFTDSLAKGLDNKCAHTVIEAKDDDIVTNKTIYIAPGGFHMILRKVGANVRTKIIDTEPENGCKPSADVLFRSAPQVYDGKLITIILTGMGNDGSKTLATLKRSGSHIIAQDEATSVVWGMPGSAVATGMVDIVLPLLEIPEAVRKLGKT